MEMEGDSLTGTLRGGCREGLQLPEEDAGWRALEQGINRVNNCLMNVSEKERFEGHWQKEMGENINGL